MQVLIAISGLLPPSDSFAASSLSRRVVILSLRSSGVRCHEPLTFRGGAGVARLTGRNQAAPGGASLQPRGQPWCLAPLLTGHEDAGCCSPWGLMRSQEGWLHRGMLPWGAAPPTPQEQDPCSAAGSRAGCPGTRCLWPGDGQAVRAAPLLSLAPLWCLPPSPACRATY